MKKIMLLALFLTAPLFAGNQPTYSIKDPAIQRNFEDSSYQAAQHRHTGKDGSAKPRDIIPEESNSYSLGASDAHWFYIYVDTVSITNQFVMKKPNGTCAACGPDNTNAWSCASVTCP